MKLSMLVPSKRPAGLIALSDSLRQHSATDDIELVVLVDDPLEYVEFHHNLTVVHYPPMRPLSIAHLLQQCYERSMGEWVMFANDDIVCQTPGWDQLVFEAMDQHGDLALLWPDDNLFGPKLACFPIVSRTLLDLIGFFPQPYHRYKVDDTLFQVVPPELRVYLPHVRFAHLNDHGDVGYRFPDGRVYPVDREAAVYDSAQWVMQADARRRMHYLVKEQRWLKSNR